MKGETTMEINDVLKELDASLRGNYYLLRCPECGKKEAFLYLDDIKKFQKNSTYKIPIRCNRMNKCGKITYLNDIINVPIQIQKMPKEKSPVQISEEGINFIRSFVHYSVETIHCEYKDFDFDIRGISNKTLKENGVFYYSKGFEQIVNSDELKRSFSKKYRNKSYKGRNIFIPIFDIDGKLVRILLRSTKNVEKKEIGLMLIQGSTEVWNLKDILDSKKKTVVITEGVYDALSFREVNKKLGIVSLPGVRKYRQIISIVKDNIDICKDKTFVIATDNDEAGQKAKEKLIEEFEKMEINYKTFDLGIHKDANEFLQENRIGFSLKAKKL